MIDGETAGPSEPELTEHQHRWQQAGAVFDADHNYVPNPERYVVCAVCCVARLAAADSAPTPTPLTGSRDRDRRVR